MKFAIVFVVVVLLHESYGRWNTLEEKPGTFFSPKAVKAVNCTGVTGGICSDDPTECESFFVCIPNAGPVEGKCPAGPPQQTCNAGSCSNTPTPLCEYRDLTFKCHTEGMYPDPSSCKKYNYCVPPVTENGPAISATCEEGWAYNAATTSCDKRLTNKACAVTDRVVPTCTIPGQNGALKASSSYYYVCLPYSPNDFRLYPNIYKCPNNQKYVGNYVCK